MSTQSNFDLHFHKMKHDYANELPRKIGEIHDNWKTLCAEWKAENLECLMRNLYSLIGSSGTIGFPEISKAARDIVTALKSINFLEKKTSIENKQFLKDVAICLEDIEALVINIHVMERKHKPEASKIKSHIHAMTKDIIIYYLDDEFSSSQLLTKQLISYGFKCRHFRTMTDLSSAMQYSIPQLVILDLVMPDISIDKVFSLAKSIVNMGTKVFMLSGKDDFDSHLSSVRAGIHAYIEKPADVTFLVSQIRTALQLNGNRPPRVLIVDDQETIARYYAMVLQEIGMEVQVETNPQNVINIMKENIPDLVILDLNMPKVSGLELARIIRQKDQFQSVPIVFLSSDVETYKKADLLELGSDDLLAKGMPQSEFSREISSRVKRAKCLASKMYQDSLTGLLNHAQIQLAFEKEFLLSARRNKPLSVAMIDIDNFKLINDRYGHLIGDRVIIALANLLEQRLRRTDYIGRFGGEEFMLVMLDSNVEQASKLINDIRVTFSEILFTFSEHKFSVNFSAGVSDKTGINNAIEQISRADEALYRAKNRGRNVVCASYINKKNEKLIS